MLIMKEKEASSKETASSPKDQKDGKKIIVSKKFTAKRIAGVREGSHLLHSGRRSRH